MDSAQQQLADRLKSANNILVTVSRDPSVDQLAACIGLSLLLNKMNKHAVAVFSGQVPSTLEFLEPGETIERTTDSLRDFIIALDKDKADKLRYKVEDNVVRIFITPYKTSISEKDLEFSQGDFNVDVVVALGVKQQEDLDEAITAHGRILHDATVASVNLSPDGGLGTINWHDPQASSLSELMTDLAQAMGDNLLDNQIATALLTGIVAETNRFSNEKTSSQTMNASSVLMAAGANQQLVATKLEEPAQPKPKTTGDDKAGEEKQEDQSAEVDDKGTLTIAHGQAAASNEDKPEDKPTDDAKPPTELPPPQLPDNPTGSTPPSPPPAAPPAPPAPQTPPANGPRMQPGARLMTGPPSLGGTLSANTQPEGLDPVTDPMSLPQSDTAQLLSRAPASPPTAQPSLSDMVPPAPSVPPAPVMPTNTPSQTLSELEASVGSPHVSEAGQPLLDNARDEVSEALKDSPTAPQPIQALNAQPLGGPIHSNDTQPPAGDLQLPPQPMGPPPEVKTSNEPVLPLGPTPTESADTNPIPQPSPSSLSPSPQVNDPTAPPPVPPPIPFQFGAAQATPPNQAKPPL